MKKRMDNKGFSLVELIIVIAIMAILIGIVGSQVIPYIEKSRISKDKDVVDTCYTALQAAVAKEGVPTIEGKTLDELNGIKGTDNQDLKLGDEVMASIGNGIKSADNLKDKLGSTAYKTSDKTRIKFWFDASDGFIAVSIVGEDAKKGKALIISSLKTSETDANGTKLANYADLDKVKQACGGAAASGGGK